MELTFQDDNGITYDFTCSDFGTSNNMGLTITKDDNKIHTRSIDVDGWLALVTALKEHKDHQHKRTLFQWIDNDLLVSGHGTQITLNDFNKTVNHFCLLAALRCLDPY